MTRIRHFLLCRNYVLLYTPTVVTVRGTPGTIPIGIVSVFREKLANILGVCCWMWSTLLDVSGTRHYLEKRYNDLKHCQVCSYI